MAGPATTNTFWNGTGAMVMVYKGACRMYRKRDIFKKLINKLINSSVYIWTELVFLLLKYGTTFHTHKKQMAKLSIYTVYNLVFCV
jgi:hypothetical protein